LAEIASFLIGGTQSGSGKTTISLGIMAALKKRGYRIQPFKCGPDFIDPTLHEVVTGRVSRNLDLRMCGSAWCKDTFVREIYNSDVGIVEGVMGLFDGGLASSGSLAATLSIPVVLVVDVRSAAESIGAVVKGFETFNPDIDVAGVIFNQVGSKKHEQLINQSVTNYCRSRILGFLPRESMFSIPDRHLGLFMGDESPLKDEKLELLIETIESCIDLDCLLTYKSSLKIDSRKNEDRSDVKGRTLRLGIAQDKAFCFYYQDNIDLLEQNGFEIHFFSPLADTALPPNLDMLYFGGGYPELYSEQLSSNKTMIEDIRKYVHNGGRIYAECGGFMYLGEKLIDQQGQSHSVVGIFPMITQMRNRLSRLGYREATLMKDCLLGQKGEQLYGHEFHYSEIIEMSSEVERIYRLQDGSYEGYRVKNVMGGYLHLHFGRSLRNIQYLYKMISES